jgi:hypothetical protein
MSTETASKSWKKRGRRPLVAIGPRGLKANRKAAARLGSRIADYARMMSDSTGHASKSPDGTFHQPGSYRK